MLLAGGFRPFELDLVRGLALRKQIEPLGARLELLRLGLGLRAADGFGFGLALGLGLW